MEGVKDSQSLQSPGARSEALAVVGELHLQQEWLGRAKAAKVTCCTLLHTVAHCCTLLHIVAHGASWCISMQPKNFEGALEFLAKCEDQLTSEMTDACRPNG